MPDLFDGAPRRVNSELNAAESTAAVAAAAAAATAVAIATDNNSSRLEEVADLVSAV
jgi:mevalonate pyrophosphate decarboxylase